jgi:hypothetical protein
MLKNEVTFFPFLFLNHPAVRESLLCCCLTSAVLDLTVLGFGSSLRFTLWVVAS